jgi:hypothetical protein
MNTNLGMTEMVMINAVSHTMADSSGVGHAKLKRGSTNDSRH